MACAGQGRGRKSERRPHPSRLRRDTFPPRQRGEGFRRCFGWGSWFRHEKDIRSYDDGRRVRGEDVGSGRDFIGNAGKFVGLSNILDSEVMQDIHRRKPMERPHRK